MSSYITEQLSNEYHDIDYEIHKRFREPFMIASVEKTKEYLQEMKQWIDIHGSAKLKKMDSYGFKTYESYLEERQRFEFPQFECDKYDEFGWTSNEEPSDEAFGWE